MEIKKQTLDLCRKVLTDETFEQLADLEAEEKWEGLSEREREALATLYVWRGTDELVKEDPAHMKSFNVSIKIAPKSADVLYWQGVAWMKEGMRHGTVDTLASADYLFEKATKLDPEHAEAWHAWAVTYCRLGVVCGDTEFFEEADSRFEKAQKLVEDEMARALLYRDWGRCWQGMGELSGEACDYRNAWDKYLVARKLELEEPTFYLDMGHTAGMLAQLLGDSRLLDEALIAYGRAVELASDDPIGWTLYGKTLRRFYQVTGDPTYLERGEACFARASELDPKLPVIWMEWGELLLLSGHHEDDGHDLEEALLKLRRAEELAGERAEITNGIVRAITELGLEGDGRLDLLKEAQERSQRGVEAHASNPDLWTRLGDSEMALSIYFSEPSHLQAAADAYQKALALESDHLDARLGIASVYFTLGLIEQNVSFLEKSAEQCAFVTEADPAAADAWSEWGLALFRWSEMTGRADLAEGALEKFDQAITLRGGWEGSPNPDWTFNYAACADFLGTLIDDEECHHQAVKVLNRLVQKSPHDPSIRFQYSLALIHLGEMVGDPECYQQANAHLGFLAQNDPDDEIIWDEWGCSLVALAHMIDDPAHHLEAQGYRQEAEDRLTRAVSLGSKEAYYHLAWLHTHQGQYEAATQCLREASQRGTLPSVEDLLRDEWLTELHETEGFQALLSELPRL